MASTSLIKGLKTLYPDSEVDYAVPLEYTNIFKYNKKISSIYNFPSNLKRSYDLAINIYPEKESCKFMSDIDSKQKMGYGYKDDNIVSLDDVSDKYHKVILGEKASSKHYLQILYKISGMTWRGEGHDFFYFPRNRTKKNKTGICVKDKNLKYFIDNNLKLNRSEICDVPIKNNIIKKIDEINRVGQIITDDLATVYAAIAMRKYVEFLDINNFNMSIEFFNKGHHHKINNANWNF